MEAYLDNAATTRAYDSVAEVVSKVLTCDYGNPSSLHTKGMDAERYVKDAREAVAESLKCEPDQIIFTSCGTESNNTAIRTAVITNRHEGKHIITSAFEHDSVAQPMKALKGNGYEVTYLPVDGAGITDLSALSSAVRDDTILVSIMYVNNEIGAVQPIEEICRIVRERNPKTFIHVDATQAYGKYRLRPKKAGIDFLSASAHKIHGPKGVGFLYVSDPVKFKPLLLGGGQQDGMRSGTENVPAIAGFAEAVKITQKNMAERVKTMERIRDAFCERILKIEGASVNGPEGKLVHLKNSDEAFRWRALAAPHIVSVSFRDVQAEVLLHALEDKGVYCSSGSACSTNHSFRTHSQTLLAIGLDESLLESTLRFSFGAFTTADETEYAASCLEELVPFLRKFKRS